MSGVPYAAEITATTGGRPVSLGRAILPNRRLALRWLRRQAHRLADGLGALQPQPSISFRSPAVPDGLRAWAEAPDQQEHAMARLAAGGPDVLTVLDPAAGLLVTLAGWPVRQRRAAAGYGAPEPTPHTYPRAAAHRTGRAPRSLDRRPYGDPLQFPRLSALVRDRAGSSAGG